MANVLTSKTKSILKSLVKPEDGPDNSTKRETLNNESRIILKTLAGSTSKAIRRRNPSKLTLKTKRELERLAKTSNKKHLKKKQSAISKETLLELEILDAQLKPRHKNKKDSSTLTDETIRALAALTPADGGSADMQAIKEQISSEIIQGQPYEHIQKKMSENSLKWSVFVQEGRIPKPLISALCMYSVDTLKDIISNDNENFMAEQMLNNLLEAAFEEPSVEKVAAVVKFLPVSSENVHVYIYKTLLFSNFYALFECFKEHLPYLSPQQKNYFVRNTDQNGQEWTNIKYFMSLRDDISGHLKMIRELRLQADQMDLIAGESFAKITDFDKKTIEYWNKKSFGAKLKTIEREWEQKTPEEQKSSLDGAIAAAGGGIAAGIAAGSAITGGLASVIILAGIKLLDFGGAQSMDVVEYRKEKMICEYLYRSAQERGLPYHNNDYKKIKRFLLKNHIHTLKQNMLRAKQHADETENWWQTAIRTPLTVEEGVAAVSMLTSNESGQGFFEWVGGTVGGGIDSLLSTIGISSAKSGESAESAFINDLKKIKNTVQSLNQILIPLEKELEQFERFAKENLFFCKYFKAQMDCIDIFHKGFFNGLELNTSQAEDTLEKLQSHRKILSHLFKLSKLRLKLSKVRETINYKHQNEIIKKINKIAERLGVAVTPASSASGSASNSASGSAINSASGNESNSASGNESDPLESSDDENIDENENIDMLSYAKERIKKAANGVSQSKGGLNVEAIKKILTANGKDDNGKRTVLEQKLKNLLDKK